MGFHVVRNGDYQFLTAGHCGYSGSNTWYHAGYCCAIGGETDTAFQHMGDDVMWVNMPNSGQASDDFELQAVPDASNTMRIAWIASPCEDKPQLTIGGGSLEALELVLDRGPVPEDVACPGVGAVHEVDLVFTGDVSPDDVDAQMVGQ